MVENIAFKESNPWTLRIKTELYVLYCRYFLYKEQVNYSENEGVLQNYLQTANHHVLYKNKRIADQQLQKYLPDNCFLGDPYHFATSSHFTAT